MKYGFSRNDQLSLTADEGNADRWIVSYADFITLLFAFFVVMYSISSVNDGKFRVLAELLPEVFNDGGETSEMLDSAVAIDLGGHTIESLRNLATLESVVDERSEDLIADAAPLTIDENASVEDLRQ